MTDLQSRIGAVVVGDHSTTAWVRWYSLDCRDGFPEMLAEERHEWPGRLHMRDVADLVAELPEPADHSHAEVIGGRR